MTVLEQAVSKMQQLPSEQQQKVLHYIEFLTFDSNNFSQNWQLQVEKIAEQRAVSCYELTKKWIGMADDLPHDLSTNKKYMEGVFQY